MEAAIDLTNVMARIYRRAEGKGAAERAEIEGGRGDEWRRAPMREGGSRSDSTRRSISKHAIVSSFVRRHRRRRLRLCRRVVARWEGNGHSSFFVDENAGPVSVDENAMAWSDVM